MPAWRGLPRVLRHPAALLKKPCRREIRPQVFRQAQRRSPAVIGLGPLGPLQRTVLRPLASLTRASGEAAARLVEPSHATLAGKPHSLVIRAHAAGDSKPGH